MKIKTYRKKADGIGLTATQKKLLPIAYEYAIKNKKNSVRVNKTQFDFDFLGNEVFIKSPLDAVFYCFGFSVVD